MPGTTVMVRLAISRMGSGLPSPRRMRRTLYCEGVRPMFPKQPGEADLKLVAGTQDVQRRFLFGRLEGPLLFEFVLQAGGSHGLLALVFRLHDNSVYVN